MFHTQQAEYPNKGTRILGKNSEDQLMEVSGQGQIRHARVRLDRPDASINMFIDSGKVPGNGSITAIHTNNGLTKAHNFTWLATVFNTDDDRFVVIFDPATPVRYDRGFNLRIRNGSRTEPLTIFEAEISFERFPNGNP